MLGPPDGLGALVLGTQLGDGPLESLDGLGALELGEAPAVTISSSSAKDSNMRLLACSPTVQPVGGGSNGGGSSGGVSRACSKR